MSIGSIVAGEVASGAASVADSAVFGRAKLVAYGLVVGAIALAIFLTHRHIVSLNSQISALQAANVQLDANNKVLKQNNTVLAGNVLSLNNANTQNIQTINQLMAERKDADAAIKNLNIGNTNKRHDIDALNAQIIELLKDPKNDGKLAPVLRETIRGIESSRGQK